MPLFTYGSESKLCHSRMQKGFVASGFFSMSGPPGGESVSAHIFPDGTFSATHSEWFDCGGGGFSYLGVLFESPKHLGSGDLIYINTDKANRDGATAGTGSFWVSGDSIRLKLDETFPSASKFSALGKPLPRSVFEGHPVAL
eukprot:TRINITY_DN1661_c0_g1_i3.p1 TRINITY_DN1661_c0_g1~~TRINITY_DN1661_c0_g1_i3.p1  ORF type:complete len:142 (-),score=24.71 TRINITY_DN1661_c0_g1_i3:116-541(-)